jgi:uncharacterized membrane protein
MEMVQFQNDSTAVKNTVKDNGSIMPVSVLLQKLGWPVAKFYRTLQFLEKIGYIRITTLTDKLGNEKRIVSLPR